MTERGLTLLELTAALAVFALIALMGLQAMSGSVMLQERLSTRHTATWTAARALTLLRHDLGALVPLGFDAPDGERQAALVVDQTRGRLAMSMAGLPVLPGTTETGQGRAEWRLEISSGTLYRAFWPTLSPFTTQVRGPEQTVLGGVEEVVLRVLTAEGWDENHGTGETLQGLPQAIEVILRTETDGELRLLVAP